MKKTLICVVLTAAFLSACTISTEQTYFSEQSDAVSQTVSEPMSEDTEEDVIAKNDETENNEIGGTSPMCMEHISSYHFVTLRLMNYVGQDVFDEWYTSCSLEDPYGRLNEDFTIAAFIEQFDIPQEEFENVIHGILTEDYLKEINMTREEYLSINGYTDEQIDALYSGDKSKINEAFCGEMAYYNPDDGELYSIYWLSDHTAEDYALAAIPKSEVSRILTAAEEAGDVYSKLAEKSRTAAKSYMSETKETE